MPHHAGETDYLQRLLSHWPAEPGVFPPARALPCAALVLPSTEPAELLVARRAHLARSSCFLWTSSDQGDAFATAFARRSSRQLQQAAEAKRAASEEKGQHIVCGRSTRESGGGHDYCGIPMFYDPSTGAPFLLPVFTKPAAKVLPEADPAQLAKLQEASLAAGFRKEGLRLVAGALGNAPLLPIPPSLEDDGSSAGLKVSLTFPVPTKTAVDGVPQLPDFGPQFVELPPAAAKKQWWQRNF
eukprot:TRINITY_DN58874_c0_g1_i1.p1 TRINITY_DN58874_c0_g1~~TRINITY_DN58874_c0_g1_i1.p1  ORF type:complete len:259 (+),score=60.82 TRINITY_DN58874_c0_g1_i1:54-779(+)